MTKNALTGVVIGVVVIVVAGVMVYRSTAPNGDVVPAGEATLQEEAADGSGTGQFLQVAPTISPAAATSSTPAASGTPTASPTSTEVSISMTDTGFSPISRTIAAGTTVVFVNDGQALHWPASAVHPTHDVLPEFDSRRGVATGGRYSYTFTQTGSWNFHDHLNPRFTGTIVVQ